MVQEIPLSTAFQINYRTVKTELGDSKGFGQSLKDIIFIL